MGIFWFVATALVVSWFAPKIEKMFTADYRDDPTYKKNVRALIERNRKFEESKE